MIARSSRRYETSRKRVPGGRRLRRALRFIVLFAVTYAILHTVFLQSIRADSATMQPSVEPGDRLMLSPLLYGPRIRIFGWTLPGFSPPARGDLVAVRPAFMDDVFFGRRLANPLVRFLSLERARLDDGESWRSVIQVKRIVGLPGDSIRVERFIAYVRPAGQDRFQSEFDLSPRPYELTTEGLPAGWHGEDPFGDSMSEILLGPDEYFVMGDNRPLSLESRHWGPIGPDDLHGRLFVRFWPLTRMGAP